jgi:dTDP-4-amino-4,6-dideoxygalactose transaminase
MMSYYARKYGYRPGMYPVAEAISGRSVALPVGPHLDRADMDYIGEAVTAAIDELSGVSEGSEVA